MSQLQCGQILRTFYLGCKALLTIVLGGLPCFADETKTRPNFVVFIADDMAWDDIGAYGHPSIRTTNIDRLASEGMRFDRAYLTCSSCSPSRCSILTGRYPHSTQAGELHLPLPATQSLLTKPLSESGYWTAAVGKWHLGNQVVDQVDSKIESGPERMGDAWLDALRSRPRDKPFFMWAAHSDPHRPYKSGAVDPPHAPDEVRVPDFLPDTSAVRQDLALYYDEISRFDSHVGQVLEELERQQVAENTFVLVMTDNGRPFPHCKTRVSIPGVRTPFIIRWPDAVKPKSTTRSLVSSIDIAPTVYELAGLEPSPRFQGISFAPVLRDPRAEVRQFAFSEHNWHDYRAFERAVHTAEFCYIRNWLPNTPGTPPADAVNSPTYRDMQRLRESNSLTAAQLECFVVPRATEFLFDANADPNCIRSLADDPQYSQTLQTMRDALQTWQSQTSDQFPGEDQLTPDSFDRDSGQKIVKASHPSLAKPKAVPNR